MMDYYRRQDYKDAKHAVPSIQCANEHQMEVFTNAYYAACDIIGGQENVTYDYPEDSEEYKNAVEYLKNHEQLVSDIYSETITNFYGCGIAASGGSIVKHYRFAGKAFTQNAVEEIVKAMGY